MNKPVRIALRSLLALCLVPVAVVAYVATSTYLARPQLEGEAASVGLRQPATVSRDANGVVLIEAATRRDALHALGFVHAQERFFQMDLLRRRGAGELAELLGVSAVKSDRTARLHGFRDVAQRVLAALPAEQRELLESYSAGVNQGLDALSARPFEYVLLRAAPRPWRAADSVLVQASMYLLLQGSAEAHPELLRMELARIYGSDWAQFLLAPGSEWDAPIDASVLPEPPPALPASLQFAAVEPRQARMRDPDSYARTAAGSNNWLVGGARTRDQRAILANDMHLPLQQPNTLFRVALHVADKTAVGVGVPGWPTLFAGSNGHIAWGVTNANGDWSDVVSLARSEVQLTTQRERILVKGAAPVELDIQRSSHGPIVASDADHVYAFKWVAQEAAGNTLSFLEMIEAETLEAAVDIAASSGMPHMNLLVADQHGAGLWTILGRIPRRKGLSGEHAVAWSEAIGWDGWLTPAEYPVLRSTEHATLWTANNRVVGGEQLQKIGLGSQFALGVRARRVHAALDAVALADEAGMHRLQLDDVSLLMQRWQQLALEVAAALPDAQARTELTRVLAGWNGRAAADSPAYRIVRRFRSEVGARVMSQLLAKLLAEHPDRYWDSILPDWETPLWRIVAARPAGVLPAGAGSWQEYLGDILQREVYQPYKERYGDLQRAVWGEANALSMQHPLSGAVPLLGRWLDMPSAPMNGDTDVILAQFQGFGPAVRLVVAPGHEAEGILNMPGGQASNPFAPYYGRGHTQWQQGVAMPLLPQQIEYRLRLVPRG
jgi:penicillin amidase